MGDCRSALAAAGIGFDRPQNPVASRLRAIVAAHSKKDAYRTPRGKQLSQERAGKFGENACGILQKFATQRDNCGQERIICESAGNYSLPTLQKIRQYSGIIEAFLYSAGILRKSFV